MSTHEVPARVLIVDDDDRTRATTAAMLRGNGNELEFAASGEEAIKLAASWHPDAILLDVMMPGIDGFEVCRRLRSVPEAAAVRVYMLTALDDPKSRRAGFEAGADEYLNKPLERQEVLARLRGLARAHRNQALRSLHHQLQALLPPRGGPRRMVASPVLATAFDRALSILEMVPEPIVHVGEAGALRVMGHGLEIGPPVPGSAEPAAVVAVAAATALGRSRDLSRAVRAATARLADEHGGDTPLLIQVDLEDLHDPETFSPDDPLAAHAERVVLELVERRTSERPLDVGQRAASLRALGYRVALAGIGNDSATLDAVANVAPEMVRTDPALAAVLAGDPATGASPHAELVSSLVWTCGQLGATLIVDGIATAAQRDALRALGCEFQRGPLFASAAGRG